MGSRYSKDRGRGRGSLSKYLRPSSVFEHGIPPNFFCSLFVLEEGRWELYIYMSIRMCSVADNINILYQ